MKFLNRKYIIDAGGSFTFLEDILCDSKIGQPKVGLGRARQLKAGIFLSTNKALGLAIDDRSLEKRTNFFFRLFCSTLVCYGRCERVNIDAEKKFFFIY